ncbi:MAG TPA: MMPL family transporter, partial [Actinomycetota bacterium]|nr:MMPL family transporter [Actinomycetota bacterium]
MAGVLYRLGRLCVRRAVVVVALWPFLAVAVHVVVWRVGAETSNDLSLPGTESQQATDLLASRFPPQQNGSSPFVFHVPKGKITDSANKKAVEESYKALSKAPHVASAPDPFANAASGLVSKDGLFLVTKHHDQLGRGMERHESIARAVATSGGTIVFAGRTVIIALLSLWVAGIPLVASLGYASAVAVLTAVVAAITLLPAILSLAGGHLFGARLP